MNKILALAGLLFASSAYSENILNDQGKASEPLLQLLKLTGVSHDGSLGSIVKSTQSEWLRKPGTERWDIVDSFVGNKDKFFELFTKMDLIDQVDTQRKEYEHALWMGATFSRIKDRLNHLIELWSDGVRFNNLVILSGARPLTDGEKSLAVSSYQLTDGSCPQTEAELMKMVYEKSEMPVEMRSRGMIFIDVPMQEIKDGIFARPTTGDTVCYWLKLKPLVGNCLVVSNQPYVSYQDSVTKSLLPKEFSIETVGKKSVDTKNGVYLDTLARFLYQENKRLN